MGSRSPSFVLAVGALAVGALLSPLEGHARAFECLRTEEGADLHWGARDISWWLDAELERRFGRDVLEGPFRVWSRRECTDLRFSLDGVREGLTAGFDGVVEPVVVWRSVWPHGSGVWALTTTAYDPSTGVILDADIELDGASGALGTVEAPLTCAQVPVLDVTALLTHEVGHFVGLAHVFDAPAAVMAPGARVCEVQKRELSDDDVRGVCALYPSGVEGSGCEDDGGCRCARRPGGFGGWLSAALMFLCWRWTRSRSSCLASTARGDFGPSAS